MRWRVTAFAAVAAAVALTSPAAAGERAVVSQAGEPRLLVALERGVAPPEVAGLRRPRLVSRALNAWTATAGRSSDPTALARRVARRRGVVAAQTDAVIRRAQAGISCSGAPGTPDGYLIGAVRAGGAPLDATRPVAIVDSGIDGSLGEFSGKVVKPVNVAAGGNDVTDGDGHGTGVAGVAAARAGGMRGVAQGSPIMPVKMFGPDGSASASDLVRGIDAAVAGGAAAINVSGTGPAGDSSDAEDRVIEMAVDRAFNAGSIVVAAGGNEGTGQVDVPSAYPHVLSVAATDASDLRTSFSNFGDFVDLAAPGDAVITTAPRSLCPSGYQVASGTSFSAPAVSGAVALVDHARPALSVS
ncbi:MAG: S8 family peptidase, partial [Thermoleophilaceae bacterium]